MKEAARCCDLEGKVDVERVWIGASRVAVWHFVEEMRRPYNFGEKRRGVGKCRREKLSSTNARTALLVYVRREVRRRQSMRNRCTIRFKSSSQMRRGQWQNGEVEREEERRRRPKSW